MKKTYNLCENILKYRFIFIFFITVFINIFSLYGNWEQINSPTGGPIRQLITHNNKIYAVASVYFQSGLNISGYGAGAFVSTDDGSTWKQITKGKNDLRLVTNLAADDNYLYAAIFNGIYRTSDDGISWELIHNGLSNNFFVNNIKIINSIIYLCTTNGLYKSSDLGDNWDEISILSSSRNYTDIIDLKDSLYISKDDGVYVFENNFNPIGRKYLENTNVYKLFKIDNFIYACNAELSNLNKYVYHIYEKAEYDIFKLYKDNLFSNTEVLEFKQLNNNAILSTLKINENKEYIYKIFKSNDKGSNWSNYTSTPSEELTSALALTENSIFIGTRYSGIIKMDYKGENKNFTNNNIFNVQVTTLAFSNDNIYAGTYEKGIYYWNNEGSSWEQLQSSPTEDTGIYKEIYKLIVNNGNIYAATSHGIYKSNDNGLSWIFKKLLEYDIRDIVYENSKIYAVGNALNLHLFISTDDGITWNDKNIPSKTTDDVIYSMLIDGSNFYVGTSAGLLKSTNEGDLWINVGQNFSGHNSILSLFKSKNNILAGSLNGVYLSGDNGNTWNKTTTGLNTDTIRSLYSVGTYIFCASDSGAYVSIDNGNSWDLINSGLNNFQILGYSNNNNIIYAYMLGDAIYKSNLSSLSKIEITSIPNTVICTDTEFEIQYKINRDIIFNQGNKFNAQLSDADGNFSNSAITIGTVQSTTSGTIIAKIPAGIPFSNKYRIRIKSTSPELIGIDNLVDLTIINKSKPEITGDLNVCAGDSKTYSIPENPGFSYQWIVSKGTIIGDDNLRTVVIKWSNEDNGQVKVIQTNIADCTDSSIVSILIHPLPAKPVISLGDNTLISSSNTGNQWFLNGSLIPNETNKILTPSLNGIYSVQVTNEFGCLSVISDPFTFEHNSDFIYFEIDSSSAYPGDNVYVNIRLIKNRKFYNSNVNTLSAVFICNSSLLYPLSTDKGYIINGKRYLELDLDTTYLNQNIIKVLGFEAMLGDSVKTELSLEKIKINGVIEPKSMVKNGVFKLLGVCYDGGARLITSSGSDIIKSVMPNPADEKIIVEFVTTENSITNLYLLNTLGNVEADLYNKDIPAGAHNMTFSLKGLSIGDHYLIMETPTSKSMYKFIISR